MWTWCCETIQARTYQQGIIIPDELRGDRLSGRVARNGLRLIPILEIVDAIHQ
jgi:hypothetical protein